MATTISTGGFMINANPAPQPSQVKFTEAYPNWHYPADFVLKCSPSDDPETAHVVPRPRGAGEARSSTSRPSSSSTRLPHPEDGAPEPAATDPDTVAYYVSAPCNARQGVLRLVDAFKARPVYLTSFYYESGTPGTLERCTRRELCAAFGTLVRDWHRFWTYGADVLFHVADQLPALPDSDASDFTERFGAQLETLRKSWRDTQYRLFWAAYLLGDYLRHLSELEDAGRLPSRFPRSGLSATTRSVRFPAFSLSARAPGGVLDDYAFRAARVVNRKQRDPIGEVEDAYTDIEGLMWDMLEHKGYRVQDLGAAYDALPRTRRNLYETPNRYEPPPPPYCPDLPGYEESACSSACTSSDGHASSDGHTSSDHRPSPSK